ncbi:MAG: hypothetical protein Q7U02_13845 [Desulfosalsimonadaceae bacterium]|nr:hypothetical protein [Desulfosalsimonadaceae bacterium]
MKKKEMTKTGSPFLLYTTPDGQVSKNIFASGELLHDSVVAIFATTASDGMLFGAKMTQIFQTKTFCYF